MLYIVSAHFSKGQHHVHQYLGTNTYSIKMVKQMHVSNAIPSNQSKMLAL